LTDVIGRPFRLLLTPGNIHDVTAAPELLAPLRGARYVLGDKGYDSDALRALIRQQGGRPVIPGKANRKRKIPLDKGRYRSRHLIENAFCRLKDFRRIATRYDKLARNYLSAVALCTLLAYWI
jgi:transposase